ncbi:MAG: hypothetical protein ABJO02_09640 [Reichenbachiella sp.]|uniref:hypothetical protein n=1 Tax=Reichenbachiella sp. TaxID=2184521 RepID=UPI003296A22E
MLIELSKVREKYTKAWLLFEQFDDDSSNEVARAFDFFQTKNLLVTVKKTKPLNPDYEGTFAASILIQSLSDLKRLGRKRNRIDYYGHSTYEKALAKAIFKGFQIIEHLIIGKPLPEKPRKTR